MKNMTVTTSAKKKKNEKSAKKKKKKKSVKKMGQEGIHFSFPMIRWVTKGGNMLDPHQRIHPWVDQWYPTCSAKSFSHPPKALESSQILHCVLVEERGCGCNVATAQ